MLKKKLRRLSAMLMAGVMAVSMMGTAFAAEGDTYEAEKTYILNFNEVPFFYGTGLDVHHGYSDPAAGPYSTWNFDHDSVIFRLTDANGNEIAAYCADADTGAETNGTFAYRRINLEDATYFAEGASPLVRSIVLNSYPNISVAEMAEQAKAAGFETTNLTQSEAVSAIQQAIWKTIHGDKYTIYEHLTNDNDHLITHQKHTLDQFVDSSDLDYKASEYSKDNITNLYNYLMGLEGTAPMEAAVSSASFESAQVTYATEEDGTLTATVKTTVSAIVKDKAALTLTAVCEGKSAAEVAVKNGNNNYTLTIEGLTSVSEISLAIDGTQTLADVFLFDSEGEIRGGAESSQSLVGYDDSTLPVHAETKIVEDERILNIHKIGKVENPDKTYTKIDLANIVFDVHFVGTLEDYLAGKVEIVENPTAANAVKQVASLKTDENGEASLNLTRKGLEDGVYLVIEQQSAATTADSLTKPFYVMIPYTSDSGDSWEYVINAQPKNTLIGGPEIEKDITKLDNDKDSFDVGEAHTWIISASKPADIADGIEYKITDKLDSRLTFVKDSVKVAVEAETPLAETTVELVAGTDYTASFENNTLVVSLTEAGMDRAAEASGDYIRVYFQSKINESAGMDEVIPNTAALEYTNSTNYTYSDSSDTPEVVTGGFCLVKVDGASKEGEGESIVYKKMLAGAKFTLYREANEAESATAVEIKLEGGEVKKVVAITDLTSVADGTAACAGLAYGTYYLVETAAPENYNLLLHPVVVTIDVGTATTPVTVENFGGFELPETGGIGTTVYTLMGSMTMAASGMYIFLKKRED